MQEPEQLTLFARDTHANLFLMPGSAEAKKMTATSGLKLLDSSKKSDPVGLLVKMLLGTSHWGSIMCLMTWGGLSYSCQTFVIPAAAIGAPQKRDRVFIVAYTSESRTGSERESVSGQGWKHSNACESEVIRQGNGKVGSDGVTTSDRHYEDVAHTNCIGNDGTETDGRNQNRSESEQERQHAQHRLTDDGQNVANSSSEGLSQRRQPGLTESNSEERGRLESESERCCEVMADSKINIERGLSIGKGAQNAGPACGSQDVADTQGERCGEERTSVGRSETWTSGSGDSCEDVANAECFRQQGQRESIKPIDSTQNQDGETSGALNDSIGAKRPVKPGLGGMLDGLSDRLDEHRWPAGLGQPQHDWEPPRVASGVKNRVGRLKGLGNAVSPQQIYPVLYFIKQINDSLEQTI